MSEAMIDWLVQNLGGRIGKEFIAFIISMIPILELRGGLLAAGPAILDIPMWQAIPICVIGNLLPIPFILLLITKIFDWMKGTKKLKPIVEKLEKKALSKSDQIEKYEFWGLVIFVGIPLPGTGAWTGALIAGASRNQVPQSVSGDRDRSLPRSVYHDCTVIWIPWSSVRLGRNRMHFRWKGRCEHANEEQ